MKSKTKDLPLITYILLFIIFMTSMIALLIAFWGSSRAIFMIMIGLCFLVIYVAVPYIIYKINPNLIEHNQDNNQMVDTNTGALTARDAILQVLTIPAALMFAFICMAIILLVIR